MKTAGMIGGLGPESTVDYYRSIIARYRARNPDGSYPSLLTTALIFRRDSTWWIPDALAN